MNRLYSSFLHIHKPTKIFIIVILAMLGLSNSAWGETQTFTASGSFTVPAGVTSITVQCWGAGGGGSTIKANGKGGGGGGGGAYSSSEIAISPGTYPVVVGAGGNPNSNGENSSFNSTFVVAAGGKGGAYDSETAGVGGSSSIGDTKHAGGNGANGNWWGSNSGGGGGSAGSTGNGGNASGTSAGNGTNLNGGNGGTGVSGSQDGNTGNTYGGGGSGAVTNNKTNRNGGNGANGLVVITWTVPPGLSVTQSNLGFGYVANGYTSNVQTYSISGKSLSPASGDISITAPDNFEVSLNSYYGFSDFLNIPYTGSTLSSKTIYVRFRSPISISNYSGIINNSGGSSIAQSVVVSGTNLVYCTAGSDNPYSESISSVVFGDIINSKDVEASGYSDFSAKSTNTTIGTGYPITITNKHQYTDDKCGVWIDWNKDGDFADANEFTTTISNGDLYTTTITPPADAAIGMTRMRIRIMYSGTLSPCGNTSYGEVEDYSLNVRYQNIYRSKKTGNWNNTDTWEYSPNNGSDWLAATLTPSSTDGIIKIRDSHTVTAGSLITADQLTVDAGGTLVLGSNMIINDGTGTDITVNGWVDCGTFALTGAGSFSLNSGATLAIGSPDGITSSGATGNIQTANRNFSTGANYTYNGSAAQTTGSGMPATVNNLTVNSGSSVTLSTATTVSGNLLITKGTLNTNSKNISIGGDFTNNGVLTATGTTISFTGNSSSINGSQTTQTFNNITVSKTIGQRLSLGSNISTLNVNGDLILNSGAFEPGAASTVVSGNWTNNGGTLTSGTGVITLNGSGKTIGGTSPGTFNNLTINAGDILLGTDQTVNGTLTLTSGVLRLGAYNLTLGASSPEIVGGPWTWNGNMIVTDGSGELRKIISENSSYTFPIGDATTVSPITLDFTQGTYDQGAYAGVNVAKAKHPQISSPNYLNRYWSVSQSGIHSFLCNVTGTFPYSDLEGGEKVQTAVEFTGSLPPLNFSVLSKNTLTANQVSTFGAFTGMGLPTLSTSVSFLDGITYIHYAGPSYPKSFTVTAENATNDIIVTAPTDFEISTSWGGTYLSSILLTPTDGSIYEFIYARLKGGLAVGNYSNQNIVCSTTGLSPINVLLTNAQVTPPVICVPTGDNSGYSITLVKLGDINNVTAKTAGYNDYSSTKATNLIVGNTYQLTVNVNTNGDNVVGAKAWIDWNNAGFEWNSNFETFDLGTATNNSDGRTEYCPVTITVPAGASLGSIRMRVACKKWSASNACENNNSEVEDYTLNIINPVIETSVSSLSGFQYTAGNGPSNEVSFIVTGSGLADNIVVTPPLNYELSTLTGGIFKSSALTLNQISGKVNAIIYVRLKAGLPAGTYNTDPQHISLSSTSATTVNINCTGTVIPGISAGGGGSYCSTQPINLTSIAANYTNLYWEGPNNFYSLNTLNPTIPAPLTTAMTGDYKVTASFLIGDNKLKNGDFELGNKEVGSSYTYIDPKNTSYSKYGALGFEGTYSISTKSDIVHTLWGPYSDHTPAPGTQQMIINGATTAGTKVWSQTIAVIPHSNYQFTYWVQNVNKEVAPQSKLQIILKTGETGTVEAGPTYTANTAGGVWKQFLYNWNSGSSSSVELSLVNKQTEGNGNDFALDDLVFQQIYTASASVNVSVITTALRASVTIVASPGTTVNSGSNVTFTATAINGGLAPTYQWHKGGVAIPGATGRVYTSVPSNGDIITCSLNSSSACIDGERLVSSNAINITVNLVVNYWKGANNTSWSDASNWTAKVVPGEGDNIEFSTNSTGGNALRDLVLDGDKSIGSLTNTTSPMRRLIIPPAKSLTINGSISTGDDPDRIYIQAYPDGTQQNGSLIFHTKEPVYGTVEMYSKGHWNSKGVTYPALGGATYYYSWQFFGIPLEGVKASPTFDGSYVRRWNESGTSDHWIPLGNTDELKPFYGYEITQKVPVGKTITFKGKLVNQNFKTAKLDKTFFGNGNNLNAKFPGQHILANPYTAAIDINKFLTRNSSDIIGIDGAIYLYNTGSYADWGAQEGTSTDGSNPGQYQVVTQAIGSGLPSQIPSMQAFLIQVVTPPESGTKVDFDYGDVVKNNSLQRVKRTDASASNTAYTRIDVTGSNYSDKMWLFSNPTFTRNYDAGWDGTKMFGIALAPQLYALESDGSYQINCVDDINNTVLGFQNGVDVEYKFTFTHENMEKSYAGIYLVDLLEKKTIEITKSGTEYPFMSEPTATAIKRFKIVTRPYEKEDANSQLKIFGTKGTVFVHNLSAEAGYAQLYDMSGRFLQKLPFAPASITAFPTSIIPGVYIVKAITKNEEVTKRLLTSRGE